MNSRRMLNILIFKRAFFKRFKAIQKYFLSGGPKEFGIPNSVKKWFINHILVIDSSKNVLL